MQCNNMPLKHAAAGETTNRLSLWRLQMYLEVLFFQERKLGEVNGLTAKHTSFLSLWLLLLDVFYVI